MKTFTDEQVKLIEKFFIRPFEHLPSDYRSAPNDALGEQVKGHLTARDLNVAYLNDFKKSKQPESEDSAPVAPD